MGLDMIKLDLHSKNYDEAKRIVERYINDSWDWPENELGEIITGHSSAMRSMVIKLLEEYNKSYEIGGPLGVDTAFIRVY